MPRALLAIPKGTVYFIDPAPHGEFGEKDDLLTATKKTKVKGRIVAAQPGASPLTHIYVDGAAKTTRVMNFFGEHVAHHVYHEPTHRLTLKDIVVWGTPHTGFKYAKLEDVEVLGAVED